MPPTPPLIPALLLSNDAGFVSLVQALLKDTDFALHQANSQARVAGAIRSHAPFLCLLDLDLPDALKLGWQVRQSQPSLAVVVFTSRFTEEMYAQCRPLQPASFLTKDLSRLTLRQALELALHRPLAAQPPSVALKAAAAPPLFFKVADSYRYLNPASIAYFFFEHKVVMAKLADQTTFPIHMTLKSLEKHFEANFVRIHKSYLVNLNFIEQIYPTDHTLEVNGDTLPLGQLHRTGLLQRLRILR